jgi:glucokinase
MKYIIGIDLGGTYIKLGLLNSEYRILDRQVLHTAKFIKKESLILAIVDSINSFIAAHQLKARDALGIGIGLPGPIDSQSGIVRFLPNIPGWRDVPLRAILTRKLRIPVFIDNDANLMALAEYKLGAAKGALNAVCITLGTGVGGGLILNGRLFRGSAFAAGEIGHIPLNEEGPVCNCHGRACLERYIGNKRILETARKTFKKNISLEELSGLAGRGNTKAVNIWQETGKKIGVALTSVVNLLNPDCVVIGGGVANAGRVLFNSINKTVLARAMKTHGRQVKIFKAKLGEDSGIIGAAILVKQRGQV